MSKTAAKKKGVAASLPKTPTGIQGLDEITMGGLPQGRPTLVCGSAGCGKTLLAMEFVVRGALQFGEPGVFMSFEENAEELAMNVRSLGFDIDDLIAQKKLSVDFVRVERSEIDETGEYDLEALFIRLGHAIDSIKARRVVLDTLETLFSGLDNTAVIRAELRRLFRWLKEKGVTAIVTGERGEGTLTRQGLEEYVSDCVILLDHRVQDQISTRRLRIVKYRGSSHGANEYPFLIDVDGISVLPVTSLNLQHEVSTERVSTGIPRLDAMLGGKGIFRGSSILISGTAGTGKTSIACHLAAASCERNERCLYMAFEESPGQLIRNMHSIGLDLEPWVKKELLRFQASRPTLYGLEMHLATVHKMVEEFQPRLVIVDPISNFRTAGNLAETNCMLLRMIDYLKSAQITAVLISLAHEATSLDQTEVGISSLTDTWIMLRDIELGGERNRALCVLKSRGMAHSNQLREFLLTDRGIELTDVYLGPDSVLTGSSRMAQEAQQQAARLRSDHETEHRRRELARRKQALDAQITALRLQFESEKEELERSIAEHEASREQLDLDRREMAESRKADPDGSQVRKGGRK